MVGLAIWLIATIFVVVIVGYVLTFVGGGLLLWWASLSDDTRIQIKLYAGLFIAAFLVKILFFG